jgi:integrase
MNTTPVYLLKTSRKLPSGKRAKYWLLRWFDEHGKPKHESVGRCDQVTSKDAKAARDVKAQALGNGTALRNKPTRITLGQFLTEDRKAIAADVAPATLLEHDYASAHAKAAWGTDTPLAKLTYASGGVLKAHMQGKSPATIAKTIRTLRAAFTRAVKGKLIVCNPLADVDMPRGSRKAKDKRIFTPAEIDAIIAHSGRTIPPPKDKPTEEPTFEPDLIWQTLVKLLATSGLRRDEALNLLWSDIDLDKATVTVQPKAADTYRVGEREYATWEWSAKTEASYRTVPLPPATVGYLRRLKVKIGGSPFVFIDVKRLAQMQARIVNGRLPAKFHLLNNTLREFQRFQRAAEATANKGKPEAKHTRWRLGTLHDLRKSYCTIMASGGVPLHELRALAGHSKITTTAEFYCEVGEDVSARVQRAFAAAG